MRVQVAIDCSKGILNRAFERVVEVRESERSLYVIHNDEGGEKLEAMFNRERVLAVDRITEAEYQRLADKEGKAAGHPKSELAVYLAANYLDDYGIGFRSAEQWAMSVMENQKAGLAENTEALTKARIEIANLKGES